MALYNFIEGTGTIVPDTSGLLTSVQGEYASAFGEDLNLDPETPQGILIALEVLARAAVAANNADLANQINPDLAGGVFLDAIGNLTDLQRTPNTYSQVQATVTGVPGTIIPTSSIASLITGEEFNPVTEITLDDSGNGSGSFQAVLPGPIATPAGTLVNIISGVLGWETITNPTAGTLGALQQSDQQFRLVRRLTLAKQGSSLPEAIISGLYSANIGVTSLVFRENVTAATVTIDGVSMAPHSIYVNVTNDSGKQEYTQIVGTLTGTPGTVIPVGTIVADSTPTQYSLTVAVTLNSAGTAQGIFQSVNVGEFGTDIGDLTTIVTPVAGLSAVTNENPSTMYLISFLQDVAKQILAKKSGGCNYNLGPGDPPYGGQTIEVIEPSSGQAYNVKFGTPTPVPILVRATITVTSQFVGNAELAVKEAVLAYAAGSFTDNPGFVIGAAISAWELAAAVNIQAPGIFVTNMEIKRADGGSFSNNTITLNIWEQGTVAASSITVIQN